MTSRAGVLATLVTLTSVTQYGLRPHNAGVNCARPPGRVAVPQHNPMRVCDDDDLGFRAPQQSCYMASICGFVQRMSESDGWFESRMEFG